MKTHERMIKKNKNIKGWMKTHKLNNECFVNNIVSEMGIEISRPSLIVYIYMQMLLSFPAAAYFTKKIAVVL